MADQIPGPVGYNLDRNDIIDTSRLQNANLSEEVLKEFFLTLIQALTRIRSTINGKTTGEYILEENVPGSMFFPNPATTPSLSLPNTLRPVTRKTFIVGALQNAGTTTIAHGIVMGANTTIVHCYGAANKLTAPRSRIPLPYLNVSGATGTGNIEVRTDDTNIYITTVANGTPYTVNYIILEYLQN